MRVLLGPIDSFTEGALEVVSIPGNEIGVLRWRGDLYAMRNYCSHQGAPVCRGRLMAKLTSAAPGRLESDADVPVLVCPWHGWEFDARSGRSLGDERMQLKMWPVHVEDGIAFLKLQDPSRRLSEAAAGPASNREEARSQ